MGSWLSAIQRCRTTDDDGRGLQDRDAGRHVLVDVSPLLSGKEDDKRDIDVLLMGNRVGRLPRYARLVAAGEVIAERRPSTAFRQEETGAA
jgi:hypothetical protein